MEPARTVALWPAWLIVVAVAALGCDGTDDIDRRAQWEANEPHAYAYWFTWGSPMGATCSIRVEISGGGVVRTDLGPGERPRHPCDPAPTITDVFTLVEETYADVDADGAARLRVDHDESFGFPVDVRFEGSAIDHQYNFGVVGFEVIEPRRADG